MMRCCLAWPASSSAGDCAHFSKISRISDFTPVAEISMISMRKGTQGSAAGAIEPEHRAAQSSWLAFIARGAFLDAIFSRILGTFLTVPGLHGYWSHETSRNRIQSESAMPEGSSRFLIDSKSGFSSYFDESEWINPCIHVMTCST